MFSQNGGAPTKRAIAQFANENFSKKTKFYKFVTQKRDIYYLPRQEKSSSAEVDYITVIDGGIYPIEVKSGSSGRLKSLHIFLQTYKNSSEGIVYSMRSYPKLPEKKILFLPLYFASSATGGHQ